MQNLRARAQITFTEKNQMKKKPGYLIHNLSDSFQGYRCESGIVIFDSLLRITIKIIEATTLSLVTCIRLVFFYVKRFVQKLEQSPPLTEDTPPSCSEISFLNIIN